MKKVACVVLVALFAAAFSLIGFAGGANKGGDGKEDCEAPGKSHVKKGFVGHGGKAAGVECLLQNEDIQTELGLSGEQVEKIRVIAEEAKRNFKTQMEAKKQQGAEKPSMEGMKKKWAEMEQQRDLIDAQIKEVLTAEQQILLATKQFQRAGGLAAHDLNASLLGFLGLSGDQVTQIRAIEDERKSAFLAMMKDKNHEEGKKHGPDMWAKGAEMKTQFADKIKAILTPEQLAVAEQLTAEGKAGKMKDCDKSEDCEGKEKKHEK